MTASDSAHLVVFQKWRSLATILSSTVASLGFAIIPLTVSFLLRTYALNGALLLLAGIILHCVVLGMFYPSKYKKVCTTEQQSCSGHLPHPRKKPSLKQKYITLIKSPSFWCLAGSQLDIDALSNGCRVFLLDRAILQGIPESKAVLSISLWGIFSTICKLFAQLPIINKTPRRRQVAKVILTFCWSLVTLLSVAFKTFEGFVMYCILAGAFHGLGTLLWYLILADITDRELLVSAYGLQSLIAVPFVMFSVPMAGTIYGMRYLT